MTNAANAARIQIDPAYHERRLAWALWDRHLDPVGERTRRYTACRERVALIRFLRVEAGR